MKLKEWIEKNCDKEIEFKDGKLTITELEVKGRWKPTLDDHYYFISAVGGADSVYWGNYESDQKSLAIGNVFKTKKEAEFTAERLKIRAEMLDLGGREYFNLHKINNRISYNHDTGQLVLDGESRFQDPFVIYFDSDINLISVIEKIGESRIKKYLFGVEEETE